MAELRERTERWLEVPLDRAFVAVLKTEHVATCMLCGALVHSALRDTHIEFHRDVAGIDDDHGVDDRE
jgi:hypothetical protein